MCLKVLSHVPANCPSNHTHLCVYNMQFSPVAVNMISKELSVPALTMDYLILFVKTCASYSVCMYISHLKMLCSCDDFSINSKDKGFDFLLILCFLVLVPEETTIICIASAFHTNIRTSQ